MASSLLLNAYGSVPQNSANPISIFAGSAPTATKETICQTTYFDNDSLPMLSFPEPTTYSPENLWKDFINEDECSEQTSAPDALLSPLPDLRNFTPRSPYNELSPFPSPYSDTSYLSEFSNSPCSPLQHDFGSPSIVPDVAYFDNCHWSIGYSPASSLPFSSLGLDDNAAYPNFITAGPQSDQLDCTRFIKAETKDMSPPPSPFSVLEASPVASPRPVVATQYTDYWDPMSPIPNAPAKLELSSTTSLSPSSISQHADFLVPPSPTTSPNVVKTRRNTRGSSKRQSPYSTPYSKSTSIPKGRPSNLSSPDASPRGQSAALHSQMLESLYIREVPALQALRIDCEAMRKPKEVQARTMEFLKDFWSRTESENRELSRLAASAGITPGNGKSKNSVASEAIMKASKDRRKREAWCWCPFWCDQRTTSPDRMGTHLWSHLGLRPYKCIFGCGQTSVTSDVFQRHQKICPENPDNKAYFKRPSSSTELVTHL